MKITFNEKEYDLRMSIRAFIIYENVVNKTFELADLTNYTNLVTMFYAIVTTTLKYNKVDHNFDFATFIDWIDEAGGNPLLVDFATWFINKQVESNDLSSQKEEEPTDKKKKRNKAKS